MQWTRDPDEVGRVDRSFYAGPHRSWNFCKYKRIPVQESAMLWFMVEKSLERNKVEAGRPVKRSLSNE